MQASRLAARRASILDAAEQLFLQRGFAATPLSAVVEKIRWFIGTLYKLFGTKEGLLAEVARRQGLSADEIIYQACQEHEDPADILWSIFRNMRKRLGDSHTIAMCRVIISQSMLDPDFARSYSSLTLDKAFAELVNLFTLWQDEGQCQGASPAAMASIFMGILVFEVHSKAVGHGHFLPRSDAQIEEEFALFINSIGLKSDTA